jgi:hypothetical protein
MFFSSSHGLGCGFGLGESPPADIPSKIDVPGELLWRDVSLNVFPIASLSGSNHVCPHSFAFRSLLARALKLRVLFALMLLLLLLVLACPGGAFDNRELWRLMGVTKGSAPGRASSVRPALEFGALARNDGVSGITLAEGDSTEPTEVGEAVHVHAGECASAIEFSSRIGEARYVGDTGFF